MTTTNEVEESPAALLDESRAWLGDAVAWADTPASGNNRDDDTRDMSLFHAVRFAEVTALQAIAASLAAVTAHLASGAP
jgi:hypothetical protein